MTTKSKLSPFEESLLPQHSIMKRLNNIFVQLRDINDSTSNVKTYAAFTQVIQSLIDDLQRDTKKHYEVLEQMTNKCTAEDEFRDKEVKDARTAVSNATASRKVCQEHLDKALALLEQAQNLLAAEEQKKKERTEIREREHNIFLSEKAQYDQAIQFLREFIQMVADKFSGNAAAPSFIQFSEELLRHTSKLGKVEATVPVLIMMSQYVAAQAGNYENWSGSDASKTLTEKLNGLLATIESDLEKIVDLENKRQADFDAFLIKVNKNIEELKASIAQLRGQIKSNRECVARETAVINEANNKITRNSDLKEKAIKMCAKFVEEVKEAQNARRIEIGVVSQILNLMKVRFGKVPERMVNYLASVENGFAEYENKTKLIAYKVYKYMALNENALGKDITADTQAYVDNKKF
jgi:chromosome segregation ATPase